MIRIEAIPREERACGYWFREGTSCVLPINRVLNGTIRLCHIHAIEIEQGSPVFLFDAEDRERILLALAC